MTYNIFRKAFGYSHKEYHRLKKVKDNRIKRKDKSINSLEKKLEEKELEFEISLEDSETLRILLDINKGEFSDYRKTSEEIIDQYRRDEKSSRELLEIIKGILGEKKYQEYSELIRNMSELKNRIDSTINANEMLKILGKYPNLVELVNGKGDHIKVYMDGQFVHNLPEGKKSSHRKDTPRIVRSKIGKALSRKLFREN